jgi:hypothetical protein
MQNPKAASGNARLAWVAWAVVTLCGVGTLGYVLLAGDNKRVFLAGPTTLGHHQIELACEACHVSPFGGTAVLQDACMGCHGDELKTANDSHPRSKFTDPRNADRVAVLDARVCVTCHREHQPELTQAMGLTLPEDYCFKCHQDVADERPTHVGLGFETCASAGCHNYHDNRALYEDFLVAQAGAPNVLADWGVRSLQRAASVPPPSHDGGDFATAAIVGEWQHSAHAEGGANCSDCHGNDETWNEAPTHDVCRECHAPQVDTFLQGRHGMRLAQSLPPMRAADAKIPMHADAAHTSLTCTACHADHAFDRRVAAVDACMGCHASTHVTAFTESPHYRLWREGTADAVSCATCHMPRLESGAPAGVFVQHNQNENLRPNEKMIRPVCMQCHSLEFSIDTLADPALIENNFNGPPQVHVDSVEMARSRSLE